MRLVGRLIIALWAISGGAGARSDWQFTRWGDTIEQILSKSVSGMRRLNSQEVKGKSIDGIGQALATSIYSTSQFTAPAVYFFRDGKLSAVRLEFTDLDETFRILNLLRGQYGDAQAGSFNRMTGGCRDVDMRWIDRERSNLVSFYAYFCSANGGSGGLLYQPRPGASDTGL